MKKIVFVFLTLVLAITLAACSSNNGNNTDATNAPSNLSGEIKIDGSSTVFPLSEALTEDFNAANPNVKVTIGESGTGGGFTKFCANEINIANASRKIKDEEAAKCKEAGVEYMELPIAYDGIAVTINIENTWALEMTTAELKKIFEANSTVKTWKDINDAWPNEEIKIYSPGDKSGTYDYFREQILGKDADGKILPMRTDAQVTFSEDDNVLVTGVSGDKNGIGFFGYSYYSNNADKIMAIGIDDGSDNGVVFPEQFTINDGTYKPLSRTLYMYVNKADYEQDSILEYVNYFINHVINIADQTGFVALSDEQYEEVLGTLE